MRKGIKITRKDLIYYVILIMQQGLKKSLKFLLDIVQLLWKNNRAQKYNFEVLFEWVFIGNSFALN